MSGTVESAFSVEGSGPPLFLVHGVGASRRSWDGLITHLRSSFRCIAYDLRGHGRTPKLSPPYSLADFVEDLERLRRELGIEKAHFAGHSLGGMIAPAYAHRYGEHVLSLGLFSTAAFRSAEDRAKLHQFVDTMRTQGVGAVLETLKDRWFTPEFAARHPDAIERRLQQLRAMDAEVYINTFAVYAESETSPWLPAIQQPTLVLTGENDLTCGPRLNRQIAAALPHAELQILPGLRHSILMEAPDQVAPPVLAFLRRQSPA
jgi:pimeloyl-ACP methyl ester carboxylesterase